MFMFTIAFRWKLFVTTCEAVCRGIEFAGAVTIFNSSLSAGGRIHVHMIFSKKSFVPWQKYRTLFRIFASVATSLLSGKIRSKIHSLFQTSRAIWRSIALRFICDFWLQWKDVEGGLLGPSLVVAGESNEWTAWLERPVYSAVANAEHCRAGPRELPWSMDLTVNKFVEMNHISSTIRRFF